MNKIQLVPINILIAFFWFTLSLLTISVAMNAIQHISRDNYSATTEIPIGITSYPSEVYGLDSSKGGHIARANINLNRPILSLSSNDLNYQFFNGFHTLAQTSLIIIINIIMLRLTISAKNNKPFQRKNIRQLYWLAGCTFLFWPIEHLKLFYYSNFVRNNFNYSNSLDLEQVDAITYQLPSNAGIIYDISIAPLIGALIFITVAQVFKNGVALKEDNESIL